MHKLLSLLLLFGVLLLCWHYHFVWNDDNYEGLLVAWYLAGAICLVYEREHIALNIKELAYANNVL